METSKKLLSYSLDGNVIVSEHYPYIVVDTASCICYKCKSSVQVKAAIEKIYREDSDVVISEMLESIEVHGMSIADTVSFYADVMKEYEGDHVIRLFYEQCSMDLWDEIEKEEQNNHLTFL